MVVPGNVPLTWINCQYQSHTPSDTQTLNLEGLDGPRNKTQHNEQR